MWLAFVPVFEIPLEACASPFIYGCCFFLNMHFYQHTLNDFISAHHTAFLCTKMPTIIKVCERYMCVCVFNIFALLCQSFCTAFCFSAPPFWPHFQYTQPQTSGTYIHARRPLINDLVLVCARAYLLYWCKRRSRTHTNTIQQRSNTYMACARA